MNEANTSTLVTVVAIVCTVLVVSGFVISLFAFWRPIFKAVRCYDKWELDKVKKAIRKARKGARLRILQTWIPDREDFMPFLKEQLTEEGKDFQLQVMLMATAPGEMLEGRIRLRAEKMAAARQNIKDTEHQLRQIAEEVNLTRISGGEPLLQLDIRHYDFMPFGPLYQIDDNIIFAGLYLNHESSMNAPMLVLTDRKSTPWKWLVEQWTRGWADATPAPVPPRLRRKRVTKKAAKKTTVKKMTNKTAGRPSADG